MMTNASNIAFNSSCINSSIGNIDAINYTGICADDTTDNNSTRPPLWETNFTLAVIYVIMMVLIVVVGTVGNIIIIVVTVVDRKVFKTGRMFIINLAVSDLCVAGIAEPICIAGVVLGEDWFNKHWFLCETVAMLCFMTCFCSFFTLFLLSFSRYIYICHHHIYGTMFSTTRNAILCVAAWTVATLLNTTTFWGWPDYSFDRKTNRCIWDRSMSLSFSITLVALLAIPVIILVIMGIMIIKKVVQSKTSLLRTKKETSKRIRAARISAIKSSYTIIISLVALLLFWTPFGIVLFIDLVDIDVYMAVTWLVHMHSVTTFIGQMLFRRTFRESVERILMC